MLKSPQPFLLHHIFSPGEKQNKTKPKVHSKEHSKGKNRFPSLSLKMSERASVFLWPLPHTWWNLLLQPGSLTLPSARVTAWPWGPQTVPAYLCWLCKIINSIPFHSQKCPRAMDQLHGQATYAPHCASPTPACVTPEKLSTFHPPFQHKTPATRADVLMSVRMGRAMCLDEHRPFQRDRTF